MTEPSPLMTKLESCWELDRAGKTEAALKLALELRADAVEGSQLQAIAMSSQCIGWLLRHLGRSTEGIEYVQEARRIWTQLGDTTERARSAAMFAWLLMEFGDDDVAAPEAADAFVLSRTVADQAVVAFVSGVYALSLNQAGDFAAALEISENALSIARKWCASRELAGHLIDRGYIFTCMADAHKEMLDKAEMSGALKEAVALNAEAISVARGCSDFWKLRIALSNGAGLFVKLGDLEQAKYCLEEWKQVPGIPQGRLLREYEYASFELLSAYGEVKDAIILAERSVNNAIISGTPHQESTFIRRLADLYEQVGDIKSALKYFKMYQAAQSKLMGDTLKRRRRFLELRNEINDLKIEVEQAQKRALELAEEASIDPLTGIANRRAFDRELQRLIDANEKISLALLDLDHFKSVNDEYSHSVGDDVLRIIGNQLSKLCRSGDLAARYGGEEFVFIFQKATLLEAADICERFRTSVSEFPWNSVAKGLRVTVSAGVSNIDEAGSTRALIEMADARLYEAKLAGRNCVIGAAHTRCLTH
jgi:diguanylate cyclase (GGDEF)-like protein